MLGPVAVPLVQPDDVESPLLGRARRPQHVVRLVAAFQSVHEDQGGAPFGIGLPVGVAEELRSGATVKRRASTGMSGDSRGRDQNRGNSIIRWGYLIKGWGMNARIRKGNLRHAKRNRKQTRDGADCRLRPRRQTFFRLTLS